MPGPEDSISDWLVWLDQIHPQNIELGLERVAIVANRLLLTPIDTDTALDNSANVAAQQKRIADKTVVVAGTNGKGSSVAALEKLLVKAGKRVGVYTSPHFQHYNERFRINGVEADDAEICAALHKIERARADVALTYFEFSTLVALELFSQAELDVAILEVGLGGRLDAVNIVRADLALITRIDLDHQDWLGDTRELIGAEKAGILRENSLFVCADADPPASVVAIAAEKGASSYFIGKHFLVSPSKDIEGFNLTTAAGVSHLLPDTGLHPASLAAAVQAAELLGLSLAPARVSSILSRVSLVGRQQLIKLAGRSLVLDVAHNPSAVQHLRTSFQSGARFAQAKRTVAVFAVMADKEWADMVDIIHDVIDHWFLAELPGNDRAESAPKIATYLQNNGQPHAECFDNVGAGVDAALLKAQQLSTDGTSTQVVVFGSFFTVAAAMEHITGTADLENG